MRSEQEICAEIMALGHGLSDPGEFRTTATRDMAETVLANTAQVSRDWLAAATPFCEDLIVKAQRADLSDADFIQALHKMSAALPELFQALDWRALAYELEKVQGTAMVNGALARYEAFDVHH